MAQPEPTLTHKHLAKALGVTVTTVKSYRRKFPEFWKVASQGKPIRFAADSLELCRRIRHHFKLGLSVEETRQRLAAEFEAVTPSPAAAGAKSRADASPETHDVLARMEALLEGLFSLQNRTHSLMAELVAKLDTLADRLGEDGADPAVAAQADSGRGEGTRADATVLPAAPAPAAREDRAIAGTRPPGDMLVMPVTVRTSEGEYLGVTLPGGRRFTLADTETYLAGSLSGASWTQAGEEWVLGGKDAGGKTQYHFHKELTPRGNTVVRLASVSTGGAELSQAALQGLLRQVKESLA